MNYRLYADLGNTRLKLAAVKNGHLLPLTPISWDELCEAHAAPEQYLLKYLLDELDHHSLDQTQCEAIVVCASSTEADDIVESLVDALQAPVRVLGRDLRANLQSRYTPPDSLGSDRVANAVAAYSEYGGPVIVMDLGSCLTTEVVSADGVFLGGHIAAGMSAVYEGIFQVAPQLEAAADEDTAEPLLPIGTSTSMALKMGVHLQIGATLDLLILACRQALDDDCARIILTGGDAASLAEGMEDDAVIVDPLLTLKGLRLIDEAAHPPQ